MTEASTDTVAEMTDTAAPQGKRYISERGPFTIWEAPTPAKPMVPPEYVEGAELVQADGTDPLHEFNIAELAAKFGETEAVVRGKVYRLIEALVPGTSSTILFSQPGVPGGMSLAHVWLGANLPLYRHSHAKYGDSLYVVLAGEVFVGKRRLGPGAGIFIPNGQPYKYSTGPAGAEVLEFRAGGGDKTAADISVEEQSLEAIEKLTEKYKALHGQWQPPEKIGETAFLQRELDFG